MCNWCTCTECVGYFPEPTDEELRRYNLQQMIEIDQEIISDLNLTQDMGKYFVDYVESLNL